MKSAILPPLNALRAFEAAARYSSVSRAAVELHVTHGAVSRQVKLLEDYLGLPLFRRDGRGLRLTAAGEKLRDIAGSAFSQLQAGVRDLRNGQGGENLTLGCSGSLLARWMIPRLERLSIDLPHLKLHLSPYAGDATTDLEGVDAALLIGDGPCPAGWQAYALAEERIGPVLSPRLPACATLSGQPVAAVLGEPLLHTESRPQAWPLWAARMGLDPAAIQPGTGFEHLYYLLEAAVAGLGIAIAPQPLVADDIANGRLAAPWGFVETGEHWRLLVRRDNPDQRIEELADWLRGQLAC
ncbi:transcriptional regulator [Pseudoxanthomonas kalamensis DSM 18571]|uniref:LysR family transcriptional regulator n=1 Tax=Pseudoxanthomonas kalamensis TaxID=289483 RepID=UPI00139207CB|nr:LysR family transcriptional regulator [Pseudoxanthomonas kalamensis]KAF1709950.1 transcriptional regulator [Pseudoxanthomonas kalamensis DSM 18571]